MRLSTLTTLLLLVAFLAPAASAQVKIDQAQLSRADGSVKAQVTSSVASTSPAVIYRGGNAVTVTQNASQEIVPVTGIACPTPPNSYYRVFDLSEFGLGSTFDVSSVDIGIEEVSSGGGTTVNLYTLDGEFVQANLTLVATTPLTVTPADNLSIVNVPISGSVDSGDRLVVEWAVPFAGVFFGGNSAGQSGPTFIRAPACGADEPEDLANLGFPDAHWVVNVNGTTPPIAGPNLFPSPGTVDFDRVAVGEDSAEETVTLTNNGTETVTITSITVDGDAFSVDTDDTDLTLDAGESTTFTVTFSPTESGPVVGSVTVTSNAQNSPLTITLAGEGFAPPPNDDFADAIVISDPGTVTGTNDSATLEDGEPVPSCVSNQGASVWWSFTPSQDGLLTVDLSDSDFDTVLTLHNADQSEIDCDDDGGTAFTSRLADVPVTGGETIYIRVAGFGGAMGNISFDLTFDAGGAIVTTPLPDGDTTGDPTFNRPFTVGDGTSGSCDLSGSGTAVSYETVPFNVNTDGNYTITTSYDGYDGFILLYEGEFDASDPCENLVALDDDFNGFGGSQIEDAPLTAGSYVLVVTGFGNTDFGPYSGTVMGPDAVGFAVANESTTTAVAGTLTASPNPTRGDGRVRLTVNASQSMSVVVYDATGRRVATLFQGAVAAGQTLDLSLQASALPAGVYMVRAQGETAQLTQQVTVTR